MPAPRRAAPGGDATDADLAAVVERLLQRIDAIGDAMVATADVPPAVIPAP